MDKKELYAWLYGSVFTAGCLRELQRRGLME